VKIVSISYDKCHISTKKAASGIMKPLSRERKEDAVESIIDRILLFCLSFLLAVLAYSAKTGVLGQKINEIVVGVLVSIIVSTFCLYFDRFMVSMVLCIIYLIAACIYSPLIFFLPLICYDACRYRQWVTPAITGLVLILHFQEIDPIFLLLLILFIILSVIITWRNKNRLQMTKELLMQKDAARELNYIMEERQKEFMQKQDYEVHVATLKERNRIAREIHDNVGHLLSRSILMVGALLAVNKEEKMNSQLKDLQDTLSGAMDNVRSSVHDLHDDSIDLHEALNKIVHDFVFCNISMDYDMGEHVERKIKYCFIAIVKEALSNVMKHSNATKVIIHLWEHPGLYQLVIKDNGTKAADLDSDKGIGLLNMKERVGAVNGTINFSFQEGFQIFVSVRKGEIEKINRGSYEDRIG